MAPVSPAPEPRPTYRSLSSLNVNVESGRGGPASAGSSGRKLSISLVSPSESGRASPVNSRRPSASQYGNPKSPYLGYRGASDGTSDAWVSICLAVLPLFNGEPCALGFEELNDTLRSHVDKTIVNCQPASSVNCQPASRARSSNAATLACGLLTAELSDLLSTGFLTLSSKLVIQPPAPPLSNERLLLRLNEIWITFFSTLISSLEAVFWPLRCDERIRASLGPGSEARLRETEGSIDVRHLALIGFRDHLILPLFPRLVELLSELYVDSRDPSRSGTPSQLARSHLGNNEQAGPPTPEKNPPSSGATLAQANARRRQMLTVLSTVSTRDERQSELELLLGIIRYGTSGSQQGAPTRTELPSRREDNLPLTPHDSPAIVETFAPDSPTNAQGESPRARSTTLESLESTSTGIDLAAPPLLSPALSTLTTRTDDSTGTNTGPEQTRSQRKGFLPMWRKDKGSGRREGSDASQSSGPGIAEKERDGAD